MLDLSSLFFTSEPRPNFLANLELDPTTRQRLRDARRDIRQCLRLGIPQVLRRGGMTTGVPAPRFFTQGSWSYKTLNAPGKPPEQQADLDDGCYLPLSFVAQSARPSVAASVFFAAAEAALEPLVTERGWKLVSKPTCIRIIIASDAHIDIPLYAIPDTEFETLRRAYQARYEGTSFTLEEVVAKAERDAWTDLPPDKVLLAHRDEDWVVSDPRAVHNWFQDEVDARGGQLLQVIRFLKAFRDWKWTTGGPTSVLLMAAVVPVFQKRDRRVDLALLDVVEQLPAILRAGVACPVDSKESLTDRLGAEGVEDAARAFEEFGRHLRGAVDSSNAAQACAWLRAQFGPRFPNEPSLASVTSVAATIAATPATPGPSELVGRTKAG